MVCAICNWREQRAKKRGEGGYTESVTLQMMSWSWQSISVSLLQRKETIYSRNLFGIKKYGLFNMLSCLWHHLRGFYQQCCVSSINKNDFNAHNLLWGKFNVSLTITLQDRFNRFVTWASEWLNAMFRVIHPLLLLLLLLMLSFWCHRNNGDFISSCCVSISLSLCDTHLVNLYRLQVVIGNI